MPAVVLGAALLNWGLGAAVTYGLLTLGQAALIAVSIVNTAYQSRRARKRAKDAYNASLSDRLQMVATVDVVRSRIYGRARNVDGVLFKATRGDKSQFFTLVVAVAGHEVDAIEDVYFGDTKVVLDASGWVLTSPWSGVPVGSSGTVTAGDTVTMTVASGSGSVTLPNTPIAGSVSVTYQTYDHSSRVADATVTGNVVSASGMSDAAFGQALVSYQYLKAASSGTSKARVRKYLGGAGQDLSTVLAPLFPSLITAGVHRFEGVACLIVDLEYDQDAYPTGVPSISAVVRGAKVFDPRTSTTAWSENPALCARDWALYAQGGGAAADELVDSSFIAAANACDVSHAFTSVNASGSSVTTTRKMFTCNVVCRPDADPADTLSILVESMAGAWAWTGGLLKVKAGAYTGPVATLTESWCGGQGDISLTANVPRTQLVNVMVPTIADAASAWVAAPGARIAADAYIEVDGGEYLQEVTLEAVTDQDHAQHVCGVMLRDARQALTMSIPCNLRAYRLEVFDTIAVTLPRFGFSAKTFSVMGWEFSLTGGVLLTLKETDASVYDPDATFSRVDPAPNTALPDPFSVPTIVLDTPLSGTDQLLKQADGTVVSRVLVTWDEITDQAVLNGGSIEIAYGLVGTDQSTWQVESVPGSTTQAYLTGVQDDAAYVIRARARNKLVAGAWGVQRVHVVVGKSAAPAAVSGLTLTVVPGGLRGTRTPSTEADWDHTEYRYGATYASGTKVPGTSDAGGFFWPWPPTGSVTIWAVDVDSSGNAGSPVFATKTIDASILITPALTTGSNQIDLNWWIRDASITWPTYGEYNRIINVAPSGGGDQSVPGPKGGNDTVWYCQEVLNNAGQGGGWDGVSLALNPARTYRFIVPIRRLAGTAGTMLWGTGNVENLNGSAAANPFFAASRPPNSDRWYLFIGYIYPQGSSGFSNNSGVFDCKTGEQIATGTNFRFKSGDGNVTHRALQDSASNNAAQLFGRPVVSLVDGTEPSLRDYFEPDAVLNISLWPSITAAQAAADAAQLDADSANALLADASDDGKLTPLEKQALRKEWDGEVSAKAGINAQAASLGITTENTAYNNALVALGTYLNGGSAWTFSTSAPPLWLSDSQLSVTTGVTGATLRSTWKSYTDAKQVLMNKIAAVAATLAQWSLVSGTTGAVTSDHLASTAATVTGYVIDTTGVSYSSAA